MSDKLRAHTLSKELGVTSKAIIAKCLSEGVEGVTNHMSTVSAGLAETIREWFSEQHHGVTAVEDAAPVDLDKVRARRRSSRKKKTAEEEKPSMEKEAAAEAPAEPVPVAPEPAIAPAVVEEASPEVVEAKPEIKLPAEPPAEPPAPAVVSPPVLVEPSPGKPAVQEPPSPPPPAKPEVLQPAAKVQAPPPEPIKPAGPQNIPAPAQMKGPRVVGFARPDPIVRPTPRATPQPPMVDYPETGGMGGKRGKGKGLAKEDIAGKRGARQRVNPRRSGASLSEVGERLREWRDRDLLERQERLEAASGRGIHTRRAREKGSSSAAPIIAPRKTKAQLSEPIVMHELCAATGIGMMQLIPKLMKDHGMGLVNRNTVIPADIAQMVMLDFGVELEIVKPKTALDRLREEFAALERKNLRPRPPVVTMLGHVDHGKTSLLDAIRKTSVTAQEAGGITQHIGAYRVERGNLSVTFLDTPGHEAFTAMRARGANLTDVVVLVVAADDGVMPQTIEAINHAKAAKVTIVVALNKIDLPGVDLNRIYAQLSEHALAPSEWGGDTDVVKTSAVTGQGVEALIDHLATLAELLNLQADPTLPACGTVIEAAIQPGMGPLARLLVQEGTLRTGDFIVCGPGAGRVRSIRDDRGRTIEQATPGTPVEVAGLDEVPNAGDRFYCLDSLQRAKEIAEEVKQQRRQEGLAKITKPQTLQDIFQQRESGKIPELRLILRADVQGSVDALLKSLSEIPSEEVKLEFLHTGIGSITESDVVLAEASGAIVVGFNVAPEPGAQQMAEARGVDVRCYRIIYDLIDDIRKALEGLLPAIRTEEFRGRAEVREVFNISRVGTIAGCMVTEGVVARSHYLRVLRDGKIIVPTEADVRRGRHRRVDSLRRFKEDVREVRAGLECGIRIEEFDDLKPGDQIEAYEIVETARKL